ncbi:hypothetical protein [Neolewinella aurantiaca]|uniref:hypothetical protein n=1 Tax=Neolewinella aurantiaca TaxID=2602767 RepID=UPI0016500F57|nr:hypothetical protein [Neolewinella aurantiaca]
MKKLITLLAVIFFTSATALFAQEMEFNVRYNFTESRYEVYALPATSSQPSGFFWGPSQITLVVPASVNDVQFPVTSVQGGAWLDNSRIYAPTVTPDVDYHAVGTLGAATPLVAGVETLIFHFTIPGSTCVPGIRLFINGSDPDSSAPGMGMGDFSNTVFGVGTAGGGEYYTGNFDNSGTVCDTDGDGTDDDMDDEPMNPCVDYTIGSEDPTNPIWGSADCDGDGVTNADEDADTTSPYDACSLVLSSVSMHATSTGDCDGDGVTDADEINGTDDDYATTGDNTDPLDPCDYNEADQGTPSVAWDAADCDDDGNPNGGDPNPVDVTATDDTGNATPGTQAMIDILANDDFLPDGAAGNLGTTTITEGAGSTAAGTVSFDATTGELLYTPVFSEAGMMVTIVYEVCNTDPDPDVCATATVTVTVSDQDTDGDGVLDSDEIDDMTDPESPCSLIIASVSMNATSTGDCDGDGVSDADEINGTDGDYSTPGDNTDPNSACSLNLGDVSMNATSTGDCDGDGVIDADEINGSDDDYATTGDNTDPLDPCDYNEADQGTPSMAWDAADCDDDGNPNGGDPNPVDVTATDDTGNATPGTQAMIDILANDDFLPDGAAGNLGTTTITEGAGSTAAGTVSFDATTGELLYTPVIAESGMMVTIVYEVCNTDPDPDVCATATVTVTVSDQDTDGDGVLDSDEIDDMTDPESPCSLVIASVSMNATSTGDCDGDGVTDADEINGTDGDYSTPGDNTDPNSACSLNLGDVSMNATSTSDCDGDGVTDADEINGSDDDYATTADNTDPLDPCDYNEADQGTPSVAWDAADCDDDGNPNGGDPNPVDVTATDDTGNATPGTQATIDILANDDFLPDGAAGNLGTTTITEGAGGTAAGTVSFDATTGELLYTPVIAESGMLVTIVYEVCNTDPDPDVCATATVTVTVSDQDTDGDGVLDSDEIDDMTDPESPCSLIIASVSMNATSTGDCDGDGVSDADEINGTDGDYSTPDDNTDPNSACSLNPGDVSMNATSTGDCDGDGVIDADEINGTDDDYSTPGDNTDPLDPCDYNEADQGTPSMAWDAADCDDDGNPNGGDPNPVDVTATDDTGNATPGTQATIDILANDDFLPDGAAGNLGTTTITEGAGSTAAGTVSFDATTGELLYTPVFSEAGMMVTIVYEVCNTDPDPDVCATATVTVTVSDQDTDGDGVLDSDEIDDMTDPESPCSLIIASVSMNATSTGDCDGDGVSDADEINGTDGDYSTPGDNTDPNSACSLNLGDVSMNATSTSDCDGDGVTDADEINGSDDDYATTGDNTDPNSACSLNLADVSMNATSTGDCDGDGVTDADEINGTDGDYSTPGDNTDPNLPCSLNYLDATVLATDTGDCDNDGISNADEINGTDGDPNTPGDNSDPLNPCDPNQNSAACLSQLELKVALQGSLFDTGSSLMRDDLRTGGFLPTTEPYTAMGGKFTHFGDGGGETTTSAVLMANDGTPDAIVDWVFVELRDATDPSVIVETRSALLQRDGDVVEAADGITPLTFSGIVGTTYYVAVKHRNHLGVMTGSAVLFSSAGVTVDFTIATATEIYDLPGVINFNGFEQVTMNGVQALWAGNANGDDQIKYQGPGTDNGPILTGVVSDAGNAAYSYNYNNSLGYSLTDINMDGKTKYQGIQNDPSYLFINLLFNYTLNAGGLYNYDFLTEQLP